MPAKNNRVHLTDKLLFSVQRPTKGSVILRDHQDSFAARVTSLSVNFFVQRKYEGESQKFTIGRHGRTAQDWTTEEARAQAAKWVKMIDEGKNPYKERDRERAEAAQKQLEKEYTFGKAFEEFVLVKNGPEAKEGAETAVNAKAGALPNGKPKSERSKEDRTYAMKRLKALPLWNMRIDKLSVPIIDENFTGLSPALVLKLQTYSASAYNQAAASRVLLANPFVVWRESKKPKPPAPRKGRLFLNKDSDSGVLWLKALVAMRQDPDVDLQIAADYLLLLLLWGTRRNETARLKETDLHLVDDHGTPCDPHLVIRASETKAKVDHFIPVTPEVHKILKARMRANAKLRANKKIGLTNDWLFPNMLDGGAYLISFRRALESLNASAGLKAPNNNVRNHDLRRSFASHFLALSGDKGKVSQALAHSSSTGDVTIGYAERLAWAEELRTFYEAREQFVMTVAGIQSKPQIPTQVRRYIESIADPTKRAAALALLTE